MLFEVLYYGLIIAIIWFVLICFWLVYDNYKGRSFMLLKHWWIPFRKSIYKFNLSHRCIFCKKYSQKKKLDVISLSNKDMIIKGDYVYSSFHSRCLKDVLERPEKYSNYLIDLAIWIPDRLKEIQRREEESKRVAEEQRESYLERARQESLSVFLDEATGKLKFAKEKI